MPKNNARVALAAVVLIGLSVSRVDAQRVVCRTLEASLDDGSLAGTTFPVTISYDADQVSRAGESFVSVLSFDFTLLGVVFTHADILQGGQAIFESGILQNVTASFQGVLPPDSPVKDITFGFGGPGVIGYIDVDNQYGSGAFRISRVDEPCCDIQADIEDGQTDEAKIAQDHADVKDDMAEGNSTDVKTDATGLQQDLRHDGRDLHQDRRDRSDDHRRQ